MYNGLYSNVLDRFYARGNADSPGGFTPSACGNGGTIRIHGGTVNARGGFYAAAIGGGYQAKGEIVEIKNADVTAIGSQELGTGIGDGYSSISTSKPCQVTISGSKVTSKAPYHCIRCDKLEILDNSEVLAHSMVDYSQDTSRVLSAFAVNYIELYDEACVRIGKSLSVDSELLISFLPAAERIASLEYNNYAEVYISPCAHTSTYYETTSEWHKKKCWTCGKKLEDEKPHIYESGDACMSCGYLGDGLAFRTKSLTLGGSIGVNFFMRLPSTEDFDYSDAYMEFTVSGKDGKTTTDPYDPGFMNDSRTLYGFTCHVSAIQMADTIKAVFHYKKRGEEKTIEKTCTVDDIIKEYIWNAEQDPDTFGRFVPLIMTMADYGHYAQICLSGQRGWKIGADHAAMETCFKTGGFSEEEATAALAALAGKGAVIRKTDDISKINASLQLDSDTSINLYIARADSYTKGIMATVDGKSVAVKKTNGRYKVEIPNIAAHELGNMYDVRIITDPNSEPTDVQISVMSYVKACLEKADLSDEERNEMMALYEYYQKAQEIVNG